MSGSRAGGPFVPGSPAPGRWRPCRGRMIPAMSERAATESTILCPFLAYGDERDLRASVPDHRHRCFADNPAGPRALAHQAAYCLTSAFAGCPTFLDWARREAAPLRDVVPPARTLRDSHAARTGASPGASSEPWERLAPVPADTAPAAPLASDARARAADDWAAAPPWVTATPRVAPADQEVATAPEEAAGDEPFDHEAVAAPAPAGSLQEPEPPAFLAGRALDDARPADYQPVAGPATRRAPVGHAGLGAEQRTEHERSVDPAAPPWERPRRLDAYPTLRTRAGFRTSGRGVPRLATLAVILGIAVLIVFAAPFLFRAIGGGSPAASPSPSPTASAAASAEPTATAEAAATPLVYTVKSGDILSKIASKYKVTVDQILQANPKITNPNKIKPGDKITIPTPPPAEIVDNGEITPAP